MSTYVKCSKACVLHVLCFAPLRKIHVYIRFNAAMLCAAWIFFIKCLFYRLVHVLEAVVALSQAQCCFYVLSCTCILMFKQHYMKLDESCSSFQFLTAAMYSAM